MKNRTASLILLFVVAVVYVLPTAQLRPSATVNWETNIPAQWFPANMLTYGGAPAPANNQVLCDGRSSFRVRVRSSQPRTRLRVEVMVDGFFLGGSSCDVVLENAGQSYVVAPTPRWDMEKLAHHDQPSPATVVVRVKADGVDIGQRTERIQLRSVNDLPIAGVGEGGQVWHNYDGFGGFVNENSPVIDQLLREALDWHAVDNFVGYQGGPKVVDLQVFAVWNALQHRGVKYSDISRESGFSGTIASQSVRFVDQTVGSSQANCVDGSVLFASVLYKIGIYPVLVLKPGHMFVGYYLEEASVGKNYHVAPVRDLQFLETTMIGSGTPPPNRRFDSSYSPWASDSYQSFAKAEEKGNQEFNAEVRDNWRDQKPGYIVMSIRNLRARGVNPIPR
jgi:hypothetical protein